MFWIDAKRIFRSGLLNFGRGGVVSYASVLVVTITLGVIGLLIFLQAVLQSSLNDIESKVDITVYITRDVSESEIMDLKSELELLPEAESVSYESSEEALTRFRNENQNDFLIIQSLDELGDNPLGASLRVTAKETSQYEAIATYLENRIIEDESRGGSIIDSINYFKYQDAIESLNSIIEGARSLGIILTVILMAISVAITFNTIRLTIFISREEIGVMRLVGAENKYIQGPFLVEGMVYGAIASIFTILIFYPFTLWLGRSMTTFLGINLFEYYKNNFLEIFFLLLISGVFLGSLSSYLAIRKYLNK